VSLPVHACGSVRTGRAGPSLGEMNCKGHKSEHAKKASYRGHEGGNCGIASFGRANRRVRKGWQAKGDGLQRELVRNSDLGTELT